MRRIGSVLIFGLLILTGCADKEAQREAKIQKNLLSDKVTPVTFVSPRVQDIQATLELSGQLKTLDEVQLGAKASGRLTMVAVRDGSRVSRGQVIATVETQDREQQVAQARAALEAARSARDQAEVQAKISPQQTDAAINQAKAALNAANARLQLTLKGARSQERAQAQERVNSAKSKVDKTKADFDRAKKLYEGDAISKSEVDAAQWQYDSALADYRTALEALSALNEGSRPEEIQQARESVREAEEQLRIARNNKFNDTIKKQQLDQANASLRQASANVNLALLQLADASVVSPVDGYVSGKAAQVGQVVSPGTPIATVIGLRGIYLEGQIPETELPTVSVGMPAGVMMDAWPGKTFQASIVAIDPKADSLGRLFAARIAITSGGSMLRPGMFGKARVTQRTIHAAVLVPLDAIVKEDGKNFVFVQNGEVAKKISVQLGTVLDQWIEVKGIASTDKVITQGKDTVADGAKIREDKPPVAEVKK